MLRQNREVATALPYIPAKVNGTGRYLRTSLMDALHNASPYCLEAHPVLAFVLFFFNAMKYAGYGLRLFSFPRGLGGALAPCLLSGRHVCCGALSARRGEAASPSAERCLRESTRVALCFVLSRVCCRYSLRSELSGLCWVF